MQIKDWKKEIFTIPNLLSLFRLVLIPVYVTIYLKARDNTDYFLAAAILAVSCLTDMIDGQIARHFNMISTIGKILDPLADKLTQFALILCFAAKYPVWRIIVLLFFVKELYQLIALALLLYAVTSDISGIEQIDKISSFRASFNSLNVLISNFL